MTTREEEQTVRGKKLWRAKLSPKRPALLGLQKPHQSERRSVLPARIPILLGNDRVRDVTQVARVIVRQTLERDLVLVLEAPPPGEGLLLGQQLEADSDVSLVSVAGDQRQQQRVWAWHEAAASALGLGLALSVPAVFAHAFGRWQADFGCVGGRGGA